MLAFIYFSCILMIKKYLNYVYNLFLISFIFIGINLGQMFPSGDFSHNCNAQNSEYQPTLNHNNTGKADYMAFPKPFESNSTSGAENQRYLKPNMWYLLLVLGEWHCIIIHTWFSVL